MRPTARLRAWKRRQEFEPGPAAALFVPGFLVRRALRQAVASFAKSASGAVLDFGCGRKPYRGLFSDVRYIGLETPVSGHPDSDKDADIYWDGTRIPLPDESVDHVLMVEVLEHLFDPRLSLAEIRRVLRPGGRLLLTCPFMWPLHEEPYDYARYTPFAIQHLLESCGFEILQLTRTGTNVEALAVLCLNDWIERCRIRRKGFRWLFTTTVCSLVNPVACLLARVVGSPRKLYLNNVCLARRREHGPL